MGPFDRKLSRSLVSSGLVNRPVVVLVSFALFVAGDLVEKERRKNDEKS